MKTVDFDIIWVEICNYPSASSIQMHSHDFFHFIYVDSGRGAITLDGTQYPMSAGTVFPISPGIEHGFYNSDSEPLVTLEIKFRLRDKECERTLVTFPPLMELVNSPVKTSLMALYRELHTKQPLSSDIISLHFNLFLTYLERCGESLRKSTLPDGRENRLSPEIERVRAYIRESFAEEITLEALSELAGFEKNYFLRKFKKQMGVTPMDYILAKRMEKAKELLRFSDMNITQIAYATGFKSVHYFSKVFYDNMKVRPSDWRLNQN